jgi:hypothetical protein
LVLLKFFGPDCNPDMPDKGYWAYLLINKHAY